MRFCLILALATVPLAAQGSHPFDPNTEIQIVLKINGMLHTVHGRAEVDWRADFLPGGVLDSVYPVRLRTETGQTRMTLDDHEFTLDGADFDFFIDFQTETNGPTLNRFGLPFEGLTTITYNGETVFTDAEFGATFVPWSELAAWESVERIAHPGPDPWTIHEITGPTWNAADDDFWSEVPIFDLPVGGKQFTVRLHQIKLATPELSLLVPEPSTIVLLGVGICLGWPMIRRRSTKSRCGP